jgi:putative SOS response-associated peptidase YedK
LSKCGRYRRTSSEEELCRIYNIPIPLQSDLPISYNIAASQRILAIRFNPKTGQRSLDALQWGLIPYWAKDPGKIQRQTSGYGPARSSLAIRMIL